VAKDTFAMLDNFAWSRVIRMLMERRRWGWKDVRRRFTALSGRWLPIAAIPVTRYRYRGSQIPSPWAAEPA
jgi:RNA-directed DNA polymerase